MGDSYARELIALKEQMLGAGWLVRGPRTAPPLSTVAGMTAFVEDCGFEIVLVGEYMHDARLCFVVRARGGDLEQLREMIAVSKPIAVVVTVDVTP